MRVWAHTHKLDEVHNPQHPQAITPNLPAHQLRKPGGGPLAGDAGGGGLDGGGGGASFTASGRCFDGF